MSCGIWYPPVPGRVRKSKINIEGCIEASSRSRGTGWYLKKQKNVVNAGKKHTVSQPLRVLRVRVHYGRFDVESDRRKTLHDPKV